MNPLPAGHPMPKLAFLCELVSWSAGLFEGEVWSLWQ